MNAIVVIPTYNERDNLETLVQRIHESAPDLHILIVDDASPDGTGDLADRLSKAQPGRIFVLHRLSKQGLGRAYVAGFGWVLERDYDFVAQMDGDLSHDPSYLPQMLDRIQQCDLVLGSRYVNGICVVNWDLKRLILSKLAGNYVRAVTGIPFSDPTSGFKCWRRATLEAIVLEDCFSIGYVFLVETTLKTFRKGLKIEEVPIIFYERNLGRSKMDWRVISEAMFNVIRLRLRR
jgi:dolichol-phosphate mannosyltransferase